jgi:pyridoxal phosphate enzyme (YggS family)
MNDTTERLEKTRKRIVEACNQAGRDPNSVRLVAVSKKHTAARIRLFYRAGQRVFGENRLEEALDKLPELDDLDIEWHFIGHVQSRKTRDIALHFDWVQSVDRVKILNRLSAQRPSGMPPLNICLQVNIDREPQKSGVTPEGVTDLARHALSLPGLLLRGLMCLPKKIDDPQCLRASFRSLREIHSQLNTAGIKLDTLSMGMSADLEQAIAEGSSMVRIGTDLMGQRPAEPLAE